VCMVYPFRTVRRPCYNSDAAALDGLVWLCPDMETPRRLDSAWGLYCSWACALRRKGRLA
ncbi:MAG: hypothetical protein Q8R28_24020, partial [Dehalococcoidia bacterium]|nr:hypothetical protein [Dehalococcoidia bacterium]